MVKQNRKQRRAAKHADEAKNLYLSDKEGSFLICVKVRSNVNVPCGVFKKRIIPPHQLNLQHRTGNA